MGHLVSAGLAIDVVNNALNGNYKIATVEGITSVYIQVSKYFDRRKQKLVQDFSDKVHGEYIPQSEALSRSLI